ncbi:hypothetical protein CcaverHIS002_0104310 [Cutaneotrichosporon cavernicola]|uniref:WIBG Mago-binding domain-containing protein n=1 Tax=Cutaneotrichosporon cavernicola TaxID=279322 RepID=A0AA48IBD0_9TREE|nr:uncharacterized protein CcaverHIS019_0104240 [Cutaneotrichosporon cavernicola]BEI79902.1 hypothetical protein CcaverHIS002_0104310 [Cutaneotrichosporon cavernicola]BEI87706.1 hypothetical protein CcaverHIS019_0104240 [Cutaneotrichosporon cavernicola]BEI95478.1 hypothetical protein CcaverHIS631_0104270 [Cutaneotrichosporon cavernicola]BEJ03252.1 hypothetical protein CcaverHIS641_0104270 [Cutaneotrichosporon cavernicola]
MSLPPLNPEKSASGIIVDPRTLERVIPASRRKDGSVRKEQKIRDGYVPQEDVGAFRGRRQMEADARGTFVPGANGRAGARGAKENPFKADPASKSKAAVKNEKRHTKRAELRSGRNWDSEDSEDDAEATRRAIEALSVKDQPEAFPPLASSPKKELSTSPSKPLSANASAWKPVPAAATTSAWKPVPAASTVPAPADPNARMSAPVPARAPNPRRQASSIFAMQSPNRKPQKPHPIQGGRIGPCGLAHPPPLEPTPARPPRRQAASMSVADRESSWRRNAAEPPRRQPSATEPRVRQPVRMREGTGGPLADRVRSLLMQNASPDRPRRATPSTPGESK